jgi:translocation and assembly module TamA
VFRLLRPLLLLALLGAALPAGASVVVTLSGLDDSFIKEIREGLALERQKDSARLTPALVSILFQRSQDEIRAALKSRGWYKAEIDAGLQQDGEHWRADFRITPGPRTRIDEVSIRIAGDGGQDRRIRAAVAAYPLKPGEPLDHGAHESGKRAIANAALERGYFDGAWAVQRIGIDPERDRAAVTLVFDSGPRYRFGAIHLPETVLEPVILERMLPFRSGDPYDTEKVLALQQRLRNSGYFRDVDVTPLFDAVADEQVPVRVALTPGPKNAFRVGLGYGTDSGPRLAGGWESRYFNRRGHRIESTLRIAPVISSLTASYLIPFFRGQPVELGLTGTAAREDTETSISNSLQLGLQRLTQRWGWNETISFSYRFEDFEVAGTSASSHLLIPAVGWWKSASDDPIYTREGFRLSLDLRGAAEGFVSNVSFAQVLLRGKYIRGLGERGRFITRAELGATAVDNIDRLPASLRFFAGGDNSIRGFEYQALGPRNAQGEITGGRYLAVASIEYEHRIRPKWSVAAFSDAGNAFNSTRNRLVYSVGGGARWHSPVGLVRVDVGVGISESDLPVRLHLIVGPDL